MLGWWKQETPIMMLHKEVLPYCQVLFWIFVDMGIYSDVQVMHLVWAQFELLMGTWEPSRSAVFGFGKNWKLITILFKCQTLLTKASIGDVNLFVFFIENTSCICFYEVVSETVCFLGNIERFKQMCLQLVWKTGECCKGGTCAPSNVQDCGHYEGENFYCQGSWYQR